MTALLEIDDLHVAYGKVEAVRGVSLRMEAGQIVTVIGPNGAGKTTLLAAAMGLLPSRGKLIYDSIDLQRLDVEGRVEHRLCLVPEKRELFGEMSVADNLLLGAYARRHEKEAIKTDLAMVYQRFPRLAERRAQHANTLSGGERQMLALGRALMARPRLLMLDEPSLGLAPRIVGDMFQVIAKLPDDGISVLLVEQNARAALRVAHHGHVLENGRITLEGPAADLRDNPRVIDTYLGLAPTRHEEAA
jgi:branched-chain amino acid transport system ATP-binding protein